MDASFRTGTGTGVKARASNKRIEMKRDAGLLGSYMSSGKIDRKIMRAVITGATLVTVTAVTLVAETHKEFRFNVGPKPGISVNNPYGSISVKPATGNVVTVNA